MKKLNDLSIFQKKREWKTMSAHPPKFIYTSGNIIHDELICGVRNDLPFYCRYYCRTSRSQDYCQRRIKSNPLSLEYVISGNLYIRRGKVGYMGEAGDLFILHPGLDYDLLCEKKTECDNIGMIFAGKNVEEILRIFQLDQTEYVHIGNTDRWMTLCQKMRDYIADGSSLETGETNVGISFEIFQMISDEKNRSPIPPDICRIMSIMEEHIDKNLSIKDLAKSFGMSLPTLNAKFREYLHRTPYQHLIHLRMQRALSLLETPASIKEIASRCGYPTPFHFSAGFKRCYGLSPLQYRREKLNIYL